MFPAICHLRSKLPRLIASKLQSNAQLDADSGTPPESPCRSPRSLRLIASLPVEATAEGTELRTPSPPSSPKGTSPDLSGADLLLCLPTPVCLVDRQGRELASNPAFKVVRGDRPGFLALLPPQELTRVKSFMAVGAPDEGSLVSHTQLAGSHGRPLELTVVSSPRSGLFIVTIR